MSEIKSPNCQNIKESVCDFPEQHDYSSAILLKTELQEQTADQELHRGSKDNPGISDYPCARATQTPTAAPHCCKRKFIDSDSTMHIVPAKRGEKF